MPNSSPVLSLSQSSLPGFCPVTEAVNALSRPGIEERGAIFTRREVVDFILDLVGYTDDQPLHKRRLLEPSFGAGDFLLPTVERLLSAWKKSDYSDPLESLSGAVRAVELHTETFQQTRVALLGVLRAGEIDDSAAEALADSWLINGHYLLAPMDGPFDVLCQRLVQEQLYTTAALLASPREAAATGEFSELSEMTNLKTFVTTFAGHIASEAAR